MINICVIGSGFVGLSTAVVFASKGNNVICADIDAYKIECINNAKPPFFEDGLDSELAKQVESGRLKATQDVKQAIQSSDIIFIAVGTPSQKDGSIDIQFVKNAAKEIALELKNKADYKVVVVKSSVVPGTTESIVKEILEKNSGRQCGKDFGLCMNPEFLREGLALFDSMNPDRIVVGEFDKRSGNVLFDLYKEFGSKIIRTEIKTAEMIKYASNVFLASRISLINEIGNICKNLGIDSYEVANAVGLDKRIGSAFLNAGCGFGGSCFEKDMNAIINKSESIGYQPNIIKESLNLNKKQKVLMVKMLEQKININNKTIAVLGLAFKPGTDDIRDSPAIDIISELLKKNAKIAAYDPKASDNMKKLFPQISYAKTCKSALQDSDACLIVTDWPEFSNLEEKDFDLMKNKIIIEGRKVLDKNKVKNFEGICW